ncbi:hypothetical protein N752_05010 [Desulforamulus aquiferis]|nr:hypothetical protein [Desulforamulus aquiferis]RYD06253.1 hypothetical protein N752_05010 [Desulforamulus aquiferis]
MKGLLRPLEPTIEYQNILQGLKRGFTQQLVFGLSGSQRSYLFAGLSHTGKAVLAITPGETEAGTLADDLASLLPHLEVKYFPVWQMLPYQVLAIVMRYYQRLSILEKLINNEPIVVVSSVEALLRRLTPLEVFRKARWSLTLVKGWSWSFFVISLLIWVLSELIW